MPKMRKIAVIYLDNSGWVEQQFENWYEFADWLKQKTLTDCVFIRNWRYVDAA